MSKNTQKRDGIQNGLLLEYATLGWNVVGVFIVIFAAINAGSIALAGFGIDSVIEILASAVVVWQLKGIDDNREAVSLRVISVSFMLLILYIFIQNARTFLAHTHPHPSNVGVIWLAVTFVAMMLLSSGKSKVGKSLNNNVLLTEGKVTRVDAYLAGAVLVGLVLNGIFGWWWADPLASLVIVYYGFRESIHAWAEANLASR